MQEVLLQILNILAFLAFISLAGFSLIFGLVSGGILANKFWR